MPAQADMPDTRAVDDDFAAAFEHAFSHLRARIEAVCASEREWPRQAALGVRAVFAFAVEHPEAAKLLTSDALSRGREGQVPYQRMISYFAALLDAGREPSGGDGASRPALAENAIAGGVALLVGRRLDQGRTEELPAAAAEAVQFVLTPYVGIDRAREIALDGSTDGSA